jgi:hypothetical protein
MVARETRQPVKDIDRAQLLGTGLVALGAGILIGRILVRIQTAGVIPVTIVAEPLPTDGHYKVTVTGEDDEGPSGFWFNQDKGQVAVRAWSGAAPVGSNKNELEARGAVYVPVEKKNGKWEGSETIELCGLSDGELVVFAAASQNNKNKEVLAGHCEVFIKQ